MNNQEPPQPLDTQFFKTNNELVNEISIIRLTGLAIDFRWPHHESLQNDSGFYVKAAYVLANITDWYCFDVIKDEETNQPIEARKRFKSELLELTDDTWARSLGLSVEELINALEFLKKKGLIDYKRLRGRGRKPYPVWPVPEKVLEITDGPSLRGSNRRLLKIDSELTSGNDIVDKIGRIAFEGNPIDYRWAGHKRFCTPKGKLNVLALWIYSNLIDWHTWSRKFNTQGVWIGVSTKFDNEEFYQDYAQWAKFFNVTKGQLQDAIYFLSKAGLIKKVVAKPVLQRSGFWSQNLPHLSPILSALEEVTFWPQKSGKNREAPPFDFQNAPQSVNKSRQKSGGNEGKNGEVNQVKIGGPLVLGTTSRFPVQQQQADESAVVVVPLASALETASNSNSLNSTEMSPNAAAPKDTPEDEEATEWPPGRRAALVRAVNELKTGIHYAVIVECVKAHPAHVALWLKWWPKQREANPDYWLTVKGTMAGALRRRLENIHNLPIQELASRRAADRRADEEEKREREEAFKREEQEGLELRRKDAHEMHRRWLALDKAAQEAIHARLLRHPDSQFKAEKIAKKGGLHKEPPGSELWCSYLEMAQRALNDELQERPKLPGMEQRAAGEDWVDELVEGEFVPPQSIRAAPMFEMYVTSVYDDVRDEIVGKNDIEIQGDLCRKFPFLGDDERKDITEEIKERLGMG